MVGGQTRRSEKRVGESVTRVKEVRSEREETIGAVAAVVCEGRAKYEGAVPVSSTRGGDKDRRRQDRVDRGSEVGGGEVVGEAVEARPGREGRIRAEKVEVNLGVGKKAIPEIVGEVGVGER